MRYNVDAITFACSVGIGHQNLKTHNRSKRAFVFLGFKHEILATVFLDKLTTCINDFIEANKNHDIVPAEIWIDTSLRKVLDTIVIEGDEVTITDIPVVTIIPNNNISHVFQEMLYYFGITIRYY